MTADVDYLVQFGKAVGSKIAKVNDATQVQLAGIKDPFGTGEDELVEDQPIYAGLGQVFRPLDPNVVAGKNAYAEVVCLRTGDGLVPFAWRDLRLNRAFPNPRAGDIAYVGYGSNFLKLAADGTVTLATTTDGTANGNLVQFQVKKTGFVLLGPFGKITYDDTGFHLLHFTGARLDLGGIGGLPPPLDELSTYAQIAAAIVKVQSSAIVLGPDTGVADNVAKSTPTLATLTAIQAALTAISGALGALHTFAAVVDPDPGTKATAGAASTAAVAAASTAIGSAGTALGTAVTTLPSSSTSVT